MFEILLENLEMKQLKKLIIHPKINLKSIHSDDKMKKFLLNVDNIVFDEEEVVAATKSNWQKMH